MDQLLRQYALRLLGQREYSTQTLRLKLAQYATKIARRNKQAMIDADAIKNADTNAADEAGDLAIPADFLAEIKSPESVASAMDELTAEPGAASTSFSESRPYQQMIELILDDLSQRQLLSDQRYSETHLRAHGNRYGNYRLKQELRQKGISTELIEQSVGDYEQSQQELERAQRLYQSKFADKPPVPTEDAKLAAENYRKKFRYLATRGFSSATIQRVLRDAMNGAASQMLDDDVVLDTDTLID